MSVAMKRRSLIVESVLSMAVICLQQVESLLEEIQSLIMSIVESGLEHNFLMRKVRAGILRNNESTRAKSSQQERRIAKAMGGRQVIGSGSTPFLKGDVVAGKLFIEAKTKMVPSQQITVKKAWIDKAKEQSLSMRKEDFAIAVSFGDDKEYYLIEDNLMEDLFKSREALRAVIEEIGGLEYNLLGLESGEVHSIKKRIKEAYE